MHSRFIAQRLNHFDSSSFRNAILRQSTVLDPIDLSIGEPEELTPEHIKAAGINAIRTDKTRYSPANGLLELRSAIAEKLTFENHVETLPGDISIVPGLTTGQLLVYLATLDPGDEIIVFDPYYPPYVSLARMLGVKVTLIPTAPTFIPNIPMVEAAITGNTKMIVINSPNNPSGAVYPEVVLRSLAGLAEKHDLLLISDEIYEHFDYGANHFSVGSIYKNTLTLGGFSKEHAMTGWRVGYIAGPSEIIQAINELQQYVVMSSSTISQHAALAALHEKTDPIVHKYQQKRDYAVQELQKLGYEIHGAQGAYYLFFKAPHNMTDLDFVNLAAEHKLLLVPGRAFSELTGYVRISYGANMHTLRRGMEVMARLTAVQPRA